MEETKCEYCGAMIKVKEDGRAQKYCSVKCRRRAYWQRRGSRPADDEFDGRATCAICGREFNATHRNQKYCSEPCQIKGKAQRDKEARIRRTLAAEKKTYGRRQCEFCGTEFEACRSHQKYCKGECRYEDQKRQAHEKRLMTALAINPAPKREPEPEEEKAYCLHCEEEYKPRDRVQRFCS